MQINLCRKSSRHWRLQKLLRIEEIFKIECWYDISGKRSFKPSSGIDIGVGAEMISTRNKFIIGFAAPRNILLKIVPLRYCESDGKKLNQMLARSKDFSWEFVGREMSWVNCTHWTLHKDLSRGNNLAKIEDLWRICWDTTANMALDYFLCMYASEDSSCSNSTRHRVLITAWKYLCVRSCDAEAEKESAAQNLEEKETSERFIFLVSFQQIRKRTNAINFSNGIILLS